MTGRIPVEEGAEETSSSSSSSSSEELVPETPKPERATRSRDRSRSRTGRDDAVHKLEIELDAKDVNYLASHPRKAAIWLSKKMEQKGKEKLWSQMTLEEKEKFDGAQAKELSNVLTAGALRSLTRQEELALDKKSVMQMRWVLTVKSDGSPKARLVALGFQAPNLTRVETSAPTMSRLGRYLLLSLCANFKFLLKSGDVTSAFLQASQSLEEENLHVWAPAQLATLFGADPHEPSKVLKVCKAFYGLVHAPRVWYERVCQTLLSHGWTQLRSDKCVFVLLEGEMLRGVAGIHVDDFLIGGDPQEVTFAAAEKALLAAYRWGKWEERSFEFAGTNISQEADCTIVVSQTDYVTKWLQEVEVSKERAQQLKSP